MNSKNALFLTTFFLMAFSGLAHGALIFGAINAVASNGEVVVFLEHIQDKLASSEILICSFLICIFHFGQIIYSIYASPDFKYLGYLGPKLQLALSVFVYVMAAIACKVAIEG